MTADKLLAWLRDRLGYVPTAWSLLRVLVVVVLTLVVVAQVVPFHPGVRDSPYNQVLGTKRSTVVSLALGDSRGFAPTTQPRRAFKTAWIGGSEMLGVKPGKFAVVPGLVNDRIGRVDGRTAHTDIYFLNAIRMADQLAAMKRAIASKPDLLVMSLNPVWVLNDLAAQQWPYLDGVLARGSTWPPSSWPVAASLLSPGDVGWRALSAVSPPVDDRFYWGNNLSQASEHLSFLSPVDGGSEPAPSGLGELALKRPVDFWQSKYDPPPKGASLTQTQLAIMKRELASHSGFNEAILREMLASARRSGIPTYFYVPAISPTVYADPDGTAYVDQLRARLATVTRGLTTEKVRLDPQGLQDRVPPTRYRDIVHKFNPGPEVEVLTGDLCRLLRETGHETECGTP